MIRRRQVFIRIKNLSSPYHWCCFIKNKNLYYPYHLLFIIIKTCLLLIIEGCSKSLIISITFQQESEPPRK